MTLVTVQNNWLDSYIGFNTVHQECLPGAGIGEEVDLEGNKI